MTKGLRRDHLAPCRVLAGERKDDPLHVTLGGIPAIEGVAVMGHAKGQTGLVLVDIENDRRRKTTQQRGHRLARQPDETEARLLALELEHPGGKRALALPFEPQRQILAVRADQAKRHRNVQRLLARLPGCGRRVLREGQRVAAVGHIEVTLGPQPGRASLAIPAHEEVEIGAIGLGHALDELVAGDRLTVVVAEVQIHAVAKTLAAEQGVQHADDFCALLVHRRGVEVVDLLIAVGADRMGHRAGILGELGGAQHPHVGDALHRTGRIGAGLASRARQHVGRELLVTEDRQPLLEGELEPVAAGHPVAGPVVEIFVRHNALDALVIDVGGGLGLGQHEFGVEDVEALVLHRTHVEVRRDDDHVAIEIEFQAEGLLVPTHGMDERIHGVPGTVQIARLDPHLQQHLSPRRSPFAALERHQRRGNQREKIAGLGKGILPAGEVSTVGQVALLDQVAVGEQHRVGRAITFERHRIARHHVGPVREPGDAAKALGLALGEQAVTRTIQPRKRGIGGGIDARHHLHLEALAADRDLHHRTAAPNRLRCGLTPVDGQRQQFERLAVEHQRPGRGIGIAQAHHAAAHLGRFGIEPEVKVDRINGVGKRPVFGALDSRGMLGSHRDSAFLRYWCEVSGTAAAGGQTRSVRPLPANRQQAALPRTQPTARRSRRSSALTVSTSTDRPSMARITVLARAS